MRISAVKLLVIAIVAATLLPQVVFAQLTDADLKRMRAEKRVALVIGDGNYRNFQQLDNPVNDATGVATALRAVMVQARIADAEDRSDEAIALLRHAADSEDALAYDEPQDWFFPARHLLGAQLLKAGQAAAAEAVYRTDLERNPNNGWSLYGLQLALTAQNKSAQAATAEREFKQAWRHADVQPSASAYWELRRSEIACRPARAKSTR